MDDKAQEILNEARRFASQGVTPTLKEVVAALAARRVCVSRQYVSRILRGTLKRERSSLKGVREEIVRQRKEGVPAADLAKKHGVTRQAIYDVLNAAKGRGEEIPDGRRRSPPKTCGVCGREFSKNSKTCSRECGRSLLVGPRKKGSRWSKYTILDLVCLRCGKHFKRTAYQQSIATRRSKGDKKNFCGRECYNLWRG